jgi:hypothetical protein
MPLGKRGMQISISSARLAWPGYLQFHCLLPCSSSALLELGPAPPG